MASKQVFAQVGVFALLGLNVGAYYVFWPPNDADKKGEAKVVAKVKGSPQLLPEKKEKPAETPTEPKEVAPAVLEGAAPLNITNPPGPIAEKRDLIDPIGRLLEHIKKESATLPLDAKATPDRDVAPRTAMVEEETPNPLPPLKANPLSEMKKADDTGIAVASALTPKVAPSPWLMAMEVLANHTQLIAKLRQPAVEFRIQCDRVEMKSNGSVVALGNVGVTGAGWKATCQRLIIPMHETKLIFEEKAHLISDTNAASSLRGDRIAWEPNALPAETQPIVAPNEFRPGEFIAPLPNSLGQPK